jgi:hypothetical protein
MGVWTMAKEEMACILVRRFNHFLCIFEAVGLHSAHHVILDCCWSLLWSRFIVSTWCNSVQ